MKHKCVPSKLILEMLLAWSRKSFNCESMNLELPWGYHMSKASYVEKEVNTKKERDVEKSLHDKTTSAPGSSYAWTQ